MTRTLVGQQPADSQELARQLRSHPFVPDLCVDLIAASKGVRT